MKMRNVMRLTCFPIHTDNNTEETTDFWHDEMIIACFLAFWLLRGFVAKSSKMITLSFP
jgi:hypothetical protein